MHHLSSLARSTESSFRLLLTTLFISFANVVSIELDDLDYIVSRVHGQGGAGSGATITLTLWFKNIVYQHSISSPQMGATYSRQVADLSILSTDHCSDPQETKIMIENTQSTDAIIFDTFSIYTVSGIWFGIDQICRADPQPDASFFLDDTVCPTGFYHYRDIGVDNDPLDFSPSQQILYFDTTRANQFIIDALMIDGTNTEAAAESCNPTKTHTKNPTETLTKSPSEIPTKNPTQNPSETPTKNPSQNPTEAPTKNPTESLIEQSTSETTIDPTTSDATAPSVYDITLSTSVISTVSTNYFVNDHKNDNTQLEVILISGGVVVFCIGCVAVILVIVFLVNSRKKVTQRNERDVQNMNENLENVKSISDEHELCVTTGDNAINAHLVMSGSAKITAGKPRSKIIKELEDVSVDHENKKGANHGEKGEENEISSDDSEQLYDHEGIKRIEEDTCTKETPARDPQLVQTAKDCMRNVSESSVKEVHHDTITTK